MSTPAAAALSGANAGGAGAGAGGGAGAGAGAGASGAGAGGDPAAGAGAANQPQFWSGWDKPEQKETRDWAANKNYADPFVLAKTAQGLEREAATLRSAKGYPADVKNADGTVTKADENARKAWNAAVGVPETADKYDIPVPEANPYPEFKTYMAEAMHQAGVPAAMAPALVKGYEAAVGKMEAQIRQAENVASEHALAQLKDSWGAQYQERVALAGRGKDWLSKEVGGLNEIQMRTLESVLGTDKFMAAMWKIGAGNGEARFAGGDSGATGFKGGASEAQTRLTQLQADRSGGKITDHAWRELSKSGGEIDQLTNTIVAGMATQQ